MKASLQTLAEENDLETGDLETEIQEQKVTIASLTNDVAETSGSIVSLTNTLAEARRSITDLTKKLKSSAAADDAAGDFEVAMQIVTDQLTEKDDVISEKNDVISALESDLAEAHTAITDLVSKLKVTTSAESFKLAAASLSNELNERSITIESLEVSCVKYHFSTTATIFICVCTNLRIVITIPCMSM